jgi:hypothetical protein
VELFGREKTLPVISRLFLALRTQHATQEFCVTEFKTEKGRSREKNLGTKYGGHSGYHTMQAGKGFIYQTLYIFLF